MNYFEIYVTEKILVRNKTKKNLKNSYSITTMEKRYYYTELLVIRRIPVSG